MAWPTAIEADDSSLRALAVLPAAAPESSSPVDPGIAGAVGWGWMEMGLGGHGSSDDLTG